MKQLYLLWTSILLLMSSSMAYAGVVKINVSVTNSTYQDITMTIDLHKDKGRNVLSLQPAIPAEGVTIASFYQPFKFTLSMPEKESRLYNNVDLYFSYTQKKEELLHVRAILQDRQCLAESMISANDLKISVSQSCEITFLSK